MNKSNWIIIGIVVLAVICCIVSIIAIALILLLIFIAGHLINAVLQALGAFIHALRLHYVEFFGQFYAGGGKKFSPFVAERERTILKKTKEG